MARRGQWDQVRSHTISLPLGTVQGKGQGKTIAGSSERYNKYSAFSPFLHATQMQDAMIYTCEEGQRKVRTMSRVLTIWAAEPAAALAVHTASRRRAPRTRSQAGATSNSSTTFSRRCCQLVCPRLQRTVFEASPATRARAATGRRRHTRRGVVMRPSCLKGGHAKYSSEKDVAAPAAAPAG